MKKNVYDIGEWVLSGVDQTRGFIVKSNSIDSEVVITSKKDGTPVPVQLIKIFGEMIPVTKLIRNYHLQPAPEFPKIFNYDELNLALMTRDKKWYDEIMSLKEVQVDE